MSRGKVDYEIYSSRDEPKELYKQAASLMRIFEDENIDKKKLIDIGGANGSFCGFIRSKNKNISLTNSEYNQKILKKHKIFFEKNKINVKVDDANLLTEKDDSFDYVTSFGVTQIFDDFIPSFSEMIRITKPGGIICNSIIVNEKDIDVIIKYLDPNSKKQISGWNKFSIKSISDFLKNNTKVLEYNFHKHEMPFDIDPKPDLLRSYTKNIDGKRIIWNDGLNMEITTYLIIIKKNLIKNSNKISLVKVIISTELSFYFFIKRLKQVPISLCQLLLNDLKGDDKEHLYLNI